MGFQIFPDTRWGRRGATLLIAGAGTAIFALLGLPLPFLFGPMSFCLIAALMGVQLEGIRPVQASMRTILGVAVGASITPAVVSQIPSMAASVALVPVYIAVIGLIGVPFFHRICGFDKATAWYAAMPGGLQDMILFGKEAGGDPRALSLIHATRVLMVVTVAPLVLTLVMGAELSNPVGAPARDLPFVEMALMVLAAFVGWKGGERLGLFGAAIVGPLIVTTALSLADIIHTRPPREAIWAAQFFIGIGVGAGYSGITLAEIKRIVLAGIAFVMILAVLAAIFTEAVVLLGLAGPIDGFLAFSPGGQAEMTVLSIVTGADLGYVVMHHLVRLVLVITCAPFAAKLLKLGVSSPKR